MEGQSDETYHHFIRVEVEFVDDDVLWISFSKDLDDSAPYGVFIEEHPMLFPLRHKAERSSKEVTAVRKKTITLVQPDVVVYMELLCFQLGLVRHFANPRKV